MRPSLLAPLLAAAAFVGVVPQASAAWPMCKPRSTPVRTGVREVGRTVRGRLITLDLRSRAMGDDQPVNVLLPERFDRSGRTRYPVLYLLHGSGGSYGSWIDGDHVQDLIGDLPAILVMPNGTENGKDGNYTDWYGAAPGDPEGAPAWESYHIHELLPFIDAHFPTEASAAGRAIAGISMGGGGATKYAAEYPGTFGYAGTFSGEAHPLLPAALAFQPKTCKWGDPSKEQVVWRDNDSADLGGNLRGVRMFIRSGDGTPGPYDSATPPTDPVKAAVRQFQLLIEFGAHLENEELAKSLHAAHATGVDVRFFHGSHSDPYWQRDMREFVAWLRAQLRRPLVPLASFSVSSAHTAFTAWGWSFTVHRGVREFAYLRIDPRRVVATGSGQIDVVTAPRYRPGASYKIRIGLATRRIVADRRGRIAFGLDLGPSHRQQQTEFGPGSTSTWRAVAASITPG